MRRCSVISVSIWTSSSGFTGALCSHGNKLVRWVYLNVLVAIKEKRKRRRERERQGLFTRRLPEAAVCVWVPLISRLSRAAIISHRERPHQRPVLCSCTGDHRASPFYLLLLWPPHHHLSSRLSSTSEDHGGRLSIIQRGGLPVTWTEAWLNSPVAAGTGQTRGWIGRRLVSSPLLHAINPLVGISMRWFWCMRARLLLCSPSEASAAVCTESVTIPDFFFMWSWCPFVLYATLIRADKPTTTF